MFDDAGQVAMVQGFVANPVVQVAKVISDVGAIMFNIFDSNSEDDVKYNNLIFWLGVFH